MKTKAIQLGGKKIPYLLRESSRAKNISLKISIEKGLEVVVPVNYPTGQVETLLREKGEWILQKLTLISQRAQQKKENSLAEKHAVRFLGKSYPVVLVFQQGYPEVELVEDRIIVMLPREYQDRVAQIIESWLRYQAKKIIMQRLEVVAKVFGVHYKQVFIKDQKTRWGSCSSQGNLNFNYRLVMAPLSVIDYLVAHEAAHLIEMNHSKKFWALVERICPNYKVQRKWLKEHGTELTL
ncbi:M48 family metallopeptidase [Desulfotomaculum sp. 1211_IL3151]|uniref:M48 family metallopeptidase n=1 Tax=Desulfotomaculum sp. 1211_IL3151 TaxID=3084055 RepID=UPI002FDB2ED8